MRKSIMELQTILRLIAIVFVLTAGGSVLAADASVYRCKGANGSVLYTDYPCDGGAAVDIHPGRADPDAKERLARAQAELDRAAAARRTREAMENAQREQMNQLRQAAENAPPPSDAYDQGYGVPYGGYYGSYYPDRFDRHDI